MLALCGGHGDGRIELCEFAFDFGISSLALTRMAEHLQLRESERASPSGVRSVWSIYGLGSGVRELHSAGARDERDLHSEFDSRLF